MGTAAAIVAIVGAAYSANEQKQARKDQRRARKIAQKQQKLQQRRETIESVRQATIARAEVAALGETAGIAGSSALTGATGSIQSQAGANIGFAQEQQRLSNQAQARLEAAASHEFKAGVGQTVSSIASQYYYNTSKKTAKKKQG